MFKFSHAFYRKQMAEVMDHIRKLFNTNKTIWKKTRTVMDYDGPVTIIVPAHSLYKADLPEIRKAIESKRLFGFGPNTYTTELMFEKLDDECKLNKILVRSSPSLLGWTVLRKNVVSEFIKEFQKAQRIAVWRNYDDVSFEFYLDYDINEDNERYRKSAGQEFVEMLENEGWEVKMDVVHKNAPGLNPTGKQVFGFNFELR